MKRAVIIELNGETRELPGPLTVMGLLQHLEIKPVMVAVEINMDVVPKASYDEHMVDPGDQVEIVSFVGGG